MYHTGDIFYWILCNFIERLWTYGWDNAYTATDFRDTQQATALPSSSQLILAISKFSGLINHNIE